MCYEMCASPRARPGHLSRHGAGSGGPVKVQPGTLVTLRPATLVTLEPVLFSRSEPGDRFGTVIPFVSFFVRSKRRFFVPTTASDQHRPSARSRMAEDQRVRIDRNGQALDRRLLLCSGHVAFVHRGRDVGTIDRDLDGIAGADKEGSDDSIGPSHCSPRCCRWPDHAGSWRCGVTRLPPDSLLNVPQPILAKPNLLADEKRGRAKCPARN